MAEKYQWFEGLKFTRDERTGYYINSTIRKRMHVYVWEYYNGKVIEGYHIHHKDGDRANNDISNLEMLDNKSHAKLHGDRLTDEQRENRRHNLTANAIPKAVEWHKSDAGSKWHKEHYEKYKDLLHKRDSLTCLNCGKVFDGISNHNNYFCSNACKSAYRRKTHVDDVKRICVICGKEFYSNKYSKTETCSFHCRGILRGKRISESKKGNENGENS